MVKNLENIKDKHTGSITAIIIGILLFISSIKSTWSRARKLPYQARGALQLYSSPVLQHQVMMINFVI